MRRASKVAEYHEGPQAAQRFERTLGHVLKVSKEELARREAAYQEASARRHRPGPKKRK